MTSAACAEAVIGASGAAVIRAAGDGRRAERDDFGDLQATAALVLGAVRRHHADPPALELVLHWVNFLTPPIEPMRAVLFFGEAPAAGDAVYTAVAALVALTANDPHYQPGFQSADTSVAAAVHTARAWRALYAGDTTGDPHFNGSTSNELTVTINPAPVVYDTTTVLGVAPTSPQTYPTAQTFTATVASRAAEMAAGSVTFSDGPTLLGEGVLDANGQATLTTATLSLGTHAITAAYGGSAQFAPSTSAVLNQIVQSRYATSTALSSTPNPSTYGQAVSLTALVTSTGPKVPSGTVTFRNGTTFLGTAPPNADGTATLTTGGLPVGANVLTATYKGNDDYAGSVSPEVIQTVTRAPTTTSLESLRNPSKVGQQVTFVARVTSAAGLPTGTLTFRDGETVLGTRTLAGGVASWTTTGLSRGSHPITATYNESANFASSTSPVVIQVVQ